MADIFELQIRLDMKGFCKLYAQANGKIHTEGAGCTPSRETSAGANWSRHCEGFHTLRRSLTGQHPEAIL